MDYSLIDQVRATSRVLIPMKDRDTGETGIMEITRHCGAYSCPWLDFKFTTIAGVTTTWSGRPAQGFRYMKRSFTREGVDAWGRPIMQPGDGHGAWSCNNHDCTDHPASLYGKIDTRAGV